MFNSKLLAIMCILTALIGSLHVGIAADDIGNATAMDRLLSKSENDRLAAYKEIDTQHENIIQSIMDIAKSVTVHGVKKPRFCFKNGGKTSQCSTIFRQTFVFGSKTAITRERLPKSKSDESDMNTGKELAIRLLGKFRVVKAIPLLIDQITFTVPTDVDEWTSAPGCPCVHALEQIGTPSLRGIIERLGKPVTDHELQLFATVFRLVDGDDLSIVRAQLAMKNADGLRKKNLEQLVLRHSLILG